MSTLRKKIAQMLIIGFNGCSIQDNSPIAKWLLTDGLGGVILFDKDLATGLYGKNISDLAQIKMLTTQLKQYAAKSASTEAERNLFIAIDYEGGAVDRLAHVEGCMSTMSALQMAKLSGTAFDDECTKMASTIQALGFNLNFAPVVDLHMHEDKGIIGAQKRSFSSNPEWVAQSARRFVEIFARHSIACCYKHFPGHGSAVGDTHEGFVDVSEHFSNDELMPYQILLKENQLPVMIMTAHVINKHLDAHGLPATLSKPILTGLLRDTLHYNGVIISDDLQMKAISEHYTLEDALCLTINAGSDMVIIGNQLGQNSAPEVIDCIERLVQNNKIQQQVIDKAYHRIKSLKQALAAA